MKLIIQSVGNTAAKPLTFPERQAKVASNLQMLKKQMAEASFPKNKAGANDHKVLTTLIEQAEWFLANAPKTGKLKAKQKTAEFYECWLVVDRLRINPGLASLQRLDKRFGAFSSLWGSLKLNCKHLVTQPETVGTLNNPKWNL